MAVIDQERLRTAVIGCGLIGTRRAAEASLHSRSRLLLCIDVLQAPARQTAERFGAAWSTDWKIAVDDERIDVVVVCTPNAFLYEIASAALERGKHVLLEKPMGCNLAEAEALAALAQRTGKRLKVGFNHRYHPGLRTAYDYFTTGAIGEPISLRVRYGHGGRPGYEKEWRCDPKRSGGGELTDQGVHVADLVHWFLGMPDRAFAYLQTAFWPIEPEDNAFALLHFEDRCVASIHTSWTQWKNLFSFELFGKNGSLTVEGLGGSYGVERLSLYKMLPAMGPPETTIWEYPGEDTSWSAEFAHLKRCIAERQVPEGTLDDAVAALEVVQQVYDQNSFDASAAKAERAA